MRKPKFNKTYLRARIRWSPQVVSNGLHRTQQNVFCPGVHLSVSSVLIILIVRFPTLCLLSGLTDACEEFASSELCYTSPNYIRLARCGSGRTWMGAWTREQVFQPYGCWRVLFDSPQTRTCLRGQRLAMVGDSTSRFMFWCLAYLLDGRTDESGVAGLLG